MHLALFQRRLVSAGESVGARAATAIGATYPSRCSSHVQATGCQTFATTARLIADAPRLKAAIDTDDPPTVQDTLASYRRTIDATRSCSNSPEKPCERKGSPKVTSIISVSVGIMVNSVSNRVLVCQYLLIC